MTSETDIDQLLMQAAAPERTRHVDLAFVTHVEQQLNATSRLSLLEVLPVFAVLLAAIVALPVMFGLAVNWDGVWSWLYEPLGMQPVLEALNNFGSRDGAAVLLWPYALGLLVVLLPAWVPTSDL